MIEFFIYLNEEIRNNQFSYLLIFISHWVSSLNKLKYGSRIFNFVDVPYKFYIYYCEFHKIKHNIHHLIRIICGIDIHQYESKQIGIWKVDSLEIQSQAKKKSSLFEIYGICNNNQNLYVRIFSRLFPVAIR